MKYVIFESRAVDDVLQLIPFIFPNFIAHGEMADAVKAIRPEYKISSAGELDVDVANLGGDSESLNVVSQPERDRRCIQVVDYLAGIVP